MSDADTIDTLERIVPDGLDAEDAAGQASLQLHAERYRFAAEHARPGRLLDLACGVGYGTRIIADLRPDLDSLRGVDLSPGAIDHARRVYATHRTDYLQADAMRFGEGEAVRYDTIVSLETIEHLPDPDGFFDHLVRLLAPGGVLIASVPTTPSVDLNPHHLHDFSLARFRAMGGRAALREIAEHRQVQRVGFSELFRPDRRFRRERLRPNLPAWYARHPGALGRRILTTLRFGLANHYSTLAWEKLD